MYPPLAHDERGVATVASVAVTAALLLVLGTALILANGLHTRHDLEFLADRAALAGAAHVREGQEAACLAAQDSLTGAEAAAGRTAAVSPHQSQLVECVVQDHPTTTLPAVFVVVQQLFVVGTLRAEAAAGPVIPR